MRKLSDKQRVRALRSTCRLLNKQNVRLKDEINSLKDELDQLDDIANKITDKYHALCKDKLAADRLVRMIRNKFVHIKFEDMTQRELEIVQELVKAGMMTGSLTLTGMVVRAPTEIVAQGQVAQGPRKFAYLEDEKRWVPVTE